ncbi:Calpain-9 [Fasciola hepatica]|uniref:Calpain-9 n=1 Tax=Fasciola hepatica TaxID=6192 RepID=A0A4E0RAX9_FASHE|nr:Calpain-9 [Fasciola hepatica]
MNQAIDKNFYGLRTYENSTVFEPSSRELSRYTGNGHGIVPADTPLRTVDEMQFRQKNGTNNHPDNERRSKSPSNVTANHTSLPRASPSPLIMGLRNPNSFSPAGSPSAAFERIRTDLIKSGHLFCDASFPADESSLYYSQRPPCHIVWMRPGEIVASNSGGGIGIAPRKISVPEFIAEGGVKLGELRQGELGDCWVVAALAAISAQPSLLTRVIPVGQSFRPEWYTGAFAFRFWRFGHWEEVIIDDRLPVRPGGQPLFVHSGRSNEFWPALLEKAYAKLNGSYEALNVGLVGDAMDDMTGGLTESYTLPAAEEQGIQPPPDLDDILIKAFDRRSLITARIKTKGIPGPGFIIPVGFVPGQAFGLTDCRKLRLTDTSGSRLVRLVRLRNLWPSVRVGWAGAWSDGSTEWLSLPPSDRAKVGLVKSEDEFWMSLEDFISNFDYLDICHLTEAPPPTPASPTGTQPLTDLPAAHLRGQWLRGVSCGGRPYIRASHWANPQFRLTIGIPDPNDPDNLATVVIALMQADRRRLRHRAPRLASIGFVLYKLPIGSHPPMPRAFFESNHHIASVDFFFDSREVVKRLRLPPGEYLVVPCTYAPDHPGDFLLRILFDHEDRTCEPALERVELTGLAANGPETDSHFEVIQPRIRRLFYEASGEAMAVDAFQLEPILNCLLRDDHRSPYGLVNTDACRALVALLDRDGSGRLTESDFRRVWEILRAWSRLFAAFDPQRTGHVTSLDFRIIVEQAGYTLPHSLLSRLVHRFVDVDWRLEYSRYINAMALITKSIAIFKNYDHGGRAILSLEQFMEVALTM